jgi:CorA-like Mg2+ transporter protein
VDHSLTTIDKAATNYFSSVTILAFVFIPLSLATSFFGMNIQELNSTGQPIWIFLATSVGILLVALTIWAIFYQWTKFLHAPRSDGFYIRPELRQKISRLTGVKLFLRVISHGHVVWCWRSGILFALLTSGRKGFTVTCNRKKCFCPAEFEMSRDSDYHYPVTFSTHDRHNPVAYIQAHLERHPSAAFSFSAAN